MPLTACQTGLFCLFFILFQPVFGQSELQPLLQNLSAEEKKSLAVFILSENSDSLDRRLEQLFQPLAPEQKKRILAHVFDEKEIDGAPIRTRAALVRDTVEFGPVRRGEKLVARAEVQNLGDRPYLISKIISPCGCLTATATEKMIAPGQKAEIKIAFDSEKTMLGPMLQTLVLRDNSLPNQRLFLVVRASVN